MNTESVQNERRKTYVVNRKYQYHYAILITLGVIIVINGAFAISYIFGGSEFRDHIGWSSVFWLVGIEIIIVGFIMRLGIRSSHCVAGPMINLTRCFEKIAKGDLTANTQFRRTDQFHELADAYNIALSSTRNRVLEIRETAQALETAQQHHEDTEKLLKQLISQINSFKLD